jgi:hypothetical protein
MQQNRIIVITAISNASIRENGIGDIEMIKGFLLAWLLCRQKWIFYGTVVVNRLISTLGVYRREEGEETNKYTATNCNHKV